MSRTISIASDNRMRAPLNGLFYVQNDEIFNHFVPELNRNGSIRPFSRRMGRLRKPKKTAGGTEVPRR